MNINTIKDVNELYKQNHSEILSNMRVLKSMNLNLRPTLLNHEVIYLANPGDIKDCLGLFYNVEKNYLGVQLINYVDGKYIPHLTLTDKDGLNLFYLYIIKNKSAQIVVDIKHPNIFGIHIKDEEVLPYSFNNFKKILNKYTNKFHKISIKCFKTNTNKSSSKKSISEK
jgi:hypothetical protein